MKINKTKDLIERVAWTFIEAEISLGLLSWLSDGVNLNLWHQVYASLGAAAAATVKVFLAQRKNRKSAVQTGAAIPGGVVEKRP